MRLRDMESVAKDIVDSSLEIFLRKKEAITAVGV
jgi:hypothetical protein